MLALLLSVLTMLSPLKLKEHKFQEQFRTSAFHYRISSFIGGLQAGKTIAGADTVHWLLYGKKLSVPDQATHFYPEVWFLSKSYTLAEAMWDTFSARHLECIIPADECRKSGLSLKGNVHWLRPNVPGGKPIRVRIRTAADPENLRATPNVIIAWADEVAHWKEAAWLNLLGRGIVTPTKYLLTTTPKGKNWLYHDVYQPGIRGEDKEILIVRCRSLDNPWASKKYLEKLRKTFGTAYADQELEAMFTDQVGYVYPMFDREKHMVDAPSQDPKFYRRVMAAADPGFRDPYSVGLWGVTKDGIWYRLREFYKTGGSTTRWMPEFKQYQKELEPKVWWVDKRRPSDIQDLRDAKLPAQRNLDIHAEDDRRTIPVMIDVVREMLRQGRIFIGRDHDFMAEEFENYHYPDEVEEREKNTNDIPVDWKNHTMDEMRYGLCSEEIESLPPRYRQGASQTPQPVAMGSAVKKIPTMAQSIAAQDERMDREDERNMGGQRNTHPRWLLNRLRSRGRV